MCVAGVEVRKGKVKIGNQLGAAEEERADSGYGFICSWAISEDVVKTGKVGKFRVCSKCWEAKREEGILPWSSSNDFASGPQAHMQRHVRHYGASLASCC